MARLGSRRVDLAVQISSLRRVLDEGKGSGSSIQTVVGRGYRFLPTVIVEPEFAGRGF